MSLSLCICASLWSDTPFSFTISPKQSPSHIPVALKCCISLRSTKASLALPDPFLYCATLQRKGSGSFPMQYWFLPRSLQGVNVIISHLQV